MTSIWCEALLRSSLQGGLAILIVFTLLRLFPSISQGVQVWLWRIVAVKLIFGLIAPITILDEPIDGTGLPHVNPLPGVIFFLSIATLVLTGVTLGRDWRRVKAIRKGGTPVNLELVRDLCRGLGIRRAPLVLLREDIDRPMLTGALRPTIHLPAGLDTGSQEMVLAHELAHVKRKDLSWEWLFICLNAVFAFHPLVWLLNREHRIAQESSCDAIALETSQVPLATYGRMLLDLTVARKGQELSIAANMAGTYSALQTRIMRLHRGQSRISPTLSACLLVSGIALLPTWRATVHHSVPREFLPDGRVILEGNTSRFGSVPDVSERVRTPKEGRP